MHVMLRGKQYNVNFIRYFLKKNFQCERYLGTYRHPHLDNHYSLPGILIKE